MTSRLGSIPEWDSSGLLPPYLISPALEGGRSPYHVGLSDVMLRFGDTTARRTLLAGLLDFRAALHAAGVYEGFQWLNGSFVEDKRGRLGEEPKDIDVVTFFHTPPGQTQEALVTAYPLLFNPEATKSQYGVDAYPVALDSSNLRYLVTMSTYWSSLWSHSKNGQWKGYLEVTLSDDEDAAARAVLDEAANPRG